MHEAVLADVEIAATGPALPVVRAAEREVPLEIVLLLHRVERRRQRGDLVVGAPLLRRQRQQAAVTVMDQADCRGQPQFDRPLRDRHRIVGVAQVAAEHGVDVDAEGGALRQHLQLCVEHLQALHRHVVGRHVVDADLEVVEPVVVEALDALLVQQVSVRDQSSQRAGAADVPDELVEVRVQQRLATADLDVRRAQPRQVVDALAHGRQRHRRRVLVVFVAIGARQVAAADRNDLRQDRMTRGLETARQHPGLSPPAVQRSEHAPRPLHTRIIMPDAARGVCAVDDDPDSVVSGDHGRVDSGPRRIPSPAARAWSCCT